MPPSAPRFARCLAVGALLSAGAAALLALLVPVLRLAGAAARDGSWRTAGFEDLLVWCCAGVATLVVCWLWLVTLGLVAAVPGGRAHAARTPGLPPWARRLVLVGCGVALTTAPAVPALAQDPVPAWTERAVAVLDGPRLPDRVAHPPRRHAEPPAPPPAEHVVTVRPGECLWSIAAADLGPGADERAVDARWRAVWARNADVVGTDPDLLRPGQRLVLPPR